MHNQSTGIENQNDLSNNFPEDDWAEASFCSHRFIPKPYPNQEELKALRKGLRKRKPPKINAGFWGNLEGVGKFLFKEVENDFQLEWNLCGDETKSELFSQLSDCICKEFMRLEAGWLIANIIDYEAQRIMFSISGPSETAQYASPYWTMAENWRHWALVPPGHMIKKIK